MSRNRHSNSFTRLRTSSDMPAPMLVLISLPQACEWGMRRKRGLPKLVVHAGRRRRSPHPGAQVCADAEADALAHAHTDLEHNWGGPKDERVDQSLNRGDDPDEALQLDREVDLRRDGPVMVDFSVRRARRGARCSSRPCGPAGQAKPTVQHSHRPASPRLAPPRPAPPRPAAPETRQEQRKRT